MNVPEAERGWEWGLLLERAGANVGDRLSSIERPFFTSDGLKVLGIGRVGTPDSVHQNDRALGMGWQGD